MQDEIRTRDALLMIWRGHKALVRNFLHAADSAITRCPYPFIIIAAVICIVIGVVNTGRARMERDYYAHKCYLMGQRCDSLQLVIEARR